MMICNKMKHLNVANIIQTLYKYIPSKTMVLLFFNPVSVKGGSYMLLVSSFREQTLGCGQFESMSRTLYSNSNMALLQ